MATVTTETTINLVTGFADSSTRKLSLGPYNSSDSAVINAKNRIKALNADPSSIENLYLSEGGAKFTGIVEANISSVEKTKLDLD